MDFTIRVVRRPVIEVPKLEASQLYQVGGYVDELIRRRVDSPSPRDVRNVPAPPLAASYKIRKMRKGRRGVRDLYYKGDMFAEMGVYRAQAGYVYVGFKTSTQYMKAFKHQKRFEWFGVADEEATAAIEKAEGMFASNMKRMGASE